MHNYWLIILRVYVWYIEEGDQMFEEVRGR